MLNFARKLAGSLERNDFWGRSSAVAVGERENTFCCIESSALSSTTILTKRRSLFNTSLISSSYPGFHYGLRISGVAPDGDAMLYQKFIEPGCWDGLRQSDIFLQSIP